MRLEVTKKKAAGTAAVAFLVLMLAGGCGSSGKQHPIERVLAPADLGVAEGACAATGFVILEPAGTTGRFPLALAVAKLGEGKGDAGTREWQVVTLKEEQAVWWNGLFNTVPAVRELIVMSAKTAGPPGVGLVAVIGKARRLNARLCLVYGPAAAGPEEAALIGALYDTQSGQAVARVQAQATPADFLQPAQRPDALHGDRRNTDAQFLAVRKFEQQVRACVMELIKRDAAPAPTTPTAPKAEK